MVWTRGGQICGSAVQSGARRPKKLKKSAVPVKSASKPKIVWRNATTNSATTSAKVTKALIRPATGGRGSVACSGTAQVLLLEGAAVDLLERLVGRFRRRAVEDHHAVAHADDAVGVVARHVDEVEVDDGRDA